MLCGPIATLPSDRHVWWLSKNFRTENQIFSERCVCFCCFCHGWRDRRASGTFLLLALPDTPILSIDIIHNTQVNHVLLLPPQLEWRHNHHFVVLICCVPPIAISSMSAMYWQTTPCLSFTNDWLLSLFLLVLEKLPRKMERFFSLSLFLLSAFLWSISSFP